MDEKERLDSITGRIIGAAIEVHKRLGPGLLESAYETCLCVRTAENECPGRSPEATTRDLPGDET